MAIRFAALAFLAACGTPADDSADLDGEPIELEWSKGQSWHLAASYRNSGIMTDESAIDLESGEGDTFGESWSEPVVWTYQVVESGLVPDESDELYPYAAHRFGVASLTVVRASASAELNDDPAILDADPVVYMVFREDRDRLAGIVSYINVDGERVEQAVSTTALGKSWSILSQSQLAMVPTYLAPFSSRWGDDERKLENGKLVTSVAMMDDVTDVFYDDEMSGGLVASRYEAGQPWPTWTVTDNMEARLLTGNEVEAIRRDLPPMNPNTETFDYRAALYSSTDIEAALLVDADMIANEGFEARVRDGFEPWAGSWWPLKKGELIWGYDNRDTLSDRIKDDIDPLKNDLDALSSELRELDDKESTEYTDKVEEYREKQQELVDKLVEFYGGVLSDLDGGKLRVEDGTLTHDDGWSYEVDELSPMDKLALVRYLEGQDYPNPFYLSAWEILNSYNPGGESWWGHCNGWAAAAILTNEPRETITHSVDGHEIAFTTADQKGLLTESHYSTYSHFYGQRYNGEDDDITDITPAAFQRIVSFYIKEKGVPLVFDTTASEAVWNFPAYQADLVMEETTPEGALDLVNVNTADFDTLDELPGIGEALGQAIIEYREQEGAFQEPEDLMDVSGIGEATYEGLADLITVNPVERTFDVVAEVKHTTDGVDETHVDDGEPKNFTETWSYTLVTDEAGTVLRGTWDDETKHPDFAWIPYNNPSSASNGNSENPYLPYGELLGVLGDDVERK